MERARPIGRVDPLRHDPLQVHCASVPEQSLARVAPSHPVLIAPMANRFSSLQQRIADMEDDFRKFYDKGNKAAGTRIRKSMQELKQVAQEIRQEIQAAKQSN